MGRASTKVALFEVGLRGPAIPASRASLLRHVQCPADFGAHGARRWDRTWFASRAWWWEPRRVMPMARTHTGASGPTRSRAWKSSRKSARGGGQIVRAKLRTTSPRDTPKPEYRRGSAIGLKTNFKFKLKAPRTLS